MGSDGHRGGLRGRWMQMRSCGVALLLLLLHLHPLSPIPLPSTSSRPLHGSRPWNRDVCSAINIMHMAYYGTYGDLPACFVRPRT